jgi:probable HAF family extracellular repeat protein
VKTLKGHWLEIVTIVWIFIFMSYAYAHAGQAESAGAWGWGHKVKPTEIDFTVELINNGIVFLGGVNRHGEIAGTVAAEGRQRAALVNRQDKMAVFDCLMFDRPDEQSTWPTAINNDGTVLGGCDSGTFGFVRRKGGHLYQFSVPGADGVSPYGMNDGEDIVGEYYTPFPAPNVSGWYRFKSFLRKASDGQIITLSAPPLPDDVGAPNSLTRTLALGINKRGKVVGTYETIFTPSNNGGMWRGFLYDNGQFTDLPADLMPRAINNDDTILAQKPDGQFVLLDDNKIFTIALPDEYRWSFIKGLTDKGELFGTVFEVSTRRFFNAVATPK